MKGEISSKGEFTGLPTFTALVHRSWSSSVDIQMSRRPMPARRSETKYNVRPSAERDGCDSHAVLFTLAPRLTGLVQSLPILRLSYRSQLPMMSGRPTHAVKISL